ncbi:MAG: hypothetical protein ACI33M_08485, partial [Lysinibacillus sp.]
MFEKESTIIYRKYIIGFNAHSTGAGISRNGEHIVQEENFFFKKSLYCQEAQKWFAQRYYILEEKKNDFTSPSFRQHEHHRQFQEIVYFLHSYKIVNDEL